MARSSSIQDKYAKKGNDSFAALLEETFGTDAQLEGSVVKGRVLEITDEAILVDVGFKSEGRIPVREFMVGGVMQPVQVGDLVDVYVERLEDRNGQAMLSREKARREESWHVLEKQFQSNERVTGIITGRVKGGFTVDLAGAIAFLPGSQDGSGAPARHSLGRNLRYTWRGHRPPSWCRSKSRRIPDRQCRCGSSAATY